MKIKKDQSNRVVFSTGDESLSTLGEELRQKFPETVQKFEKFQMSDQVVGRLVDTLFDTFPYEWKDPSSFSNAAILCIRGNYLAALGSFSEILEKEPIAYPVFHLLGYVCGNMGKYKMEVDYYKKAIKIKSDYPQIYYDLAMAYWMMGKEAKSYQAFKQGVSLAPDFTIADHWLTFASDNLGRFQDPDGLGEKELGGKVKTLAQSYYMLGQAYLELGFNALARTALKNAIRLRPEFAEAYYELGALHIKKLRNPGRKKKFLEKAEGLFIQNGNLQRATFAHQLNYSKQDVKEKDKAAAEWFKEGLRLHNLGLYQSAVSSYKVAISFQPGFQDAYYNMGIAYGNMEDAGLGKIDKAIGAFKQSVRINPEFIHAQVALGAAYIRMSEYQEAIQLLESAALKEPKNSAIFYYLGTAFRMVKNQIGAVQCLERASELAPESLQNHFALGLALTENNQYAEASEAFLEVIRIRPDFADAHFILGKIFESPLNDNEKSSFHFRKAEKLFKKIGDHTRAEEVKQILSKY